MGTSIYKAKDGKRLPSVTSILSRFKDSGGLIWWAWDLGCQGIDYRDARDNAASAGSIVHTMVERYVGGLDPFEIPDLDKTPPDILKRAHLGFDNFAKWADQSSLKIVETETPLISEEFRFGGTPDAVGIVNGKTALLDWKTSNSLHRDYLLQLAAYEQLYKENRGIEFDGGFHICRFSRDYADFEHRHFGELDQAWEMFKLLRGAFEIDKNLKKRCA